MANRCYALLLVGGVDVSDEDRALFMDDWNRLSDYSEEQLLHELMTRKEVMPAPVKTTRYTKHYCVMVGIGNDHFAEIVLDVDAYSELLGNAEQLNL